MTEQMRIGQRTFDIGSSTYIMGILNVTPDSFSDGGKYNSLDDAMYRVESMISEGADIIDVGGESTRPGYEKIVVEEEIQRVVPVIEKIRQYFDIPVSVDTYKAPVAEAALAAGADLVNDIWGFKYDFDMAGIVKKYDAACCLMHNRQDKIYTHLIRDCLDDLQGSIDIARAAGIEKDRIMIDPGVGFAKTYEQNLQVLKSLAQFNALGYPVLLGASRKSVIGLTLDVPTDERLIGTCVTTVQAVLSGTAFVRVHDIKANRQAILMAQAIKNVML